jgi:hypothetical protein
MLACLGPSFAVLSCRFSTFSIILEVFVVFSAWFLAQVATQDVPWILALFRLTLFDSSLLYSSWSLRGSDNRNLFFNRVFAITVLAEWDSEAVIFLPAPLVSKKLRITRRRIKARFVPSS